MKERVSNFAETRATCSVVPEARLDELNPDEVTNALLSVLSQESIVNHLKGHNLRTKIVEAIKFSVRLKEMKAVIYELREDLDNGVTEELVCQKWCEKYPWAFGNQIPNRSFFQVPGTFPPASCFEGGKLREASIFLDESGSGRLCDFHWKRG